MNAILEVLRRECMEAIDSFSEAYLFGSSLHETNPDDIDLLLVYEGHADRHIEEKKDTIFKLLMVAVGIECHFVTLSKNEVDQAGFLNHVVYERIK